MSDKNLISLYEKDSGQTINYGDLANPAGSDTLKITSGAHDITVIGESIRGGKEDCLDTNNRAKDNDVHFDEWISGGRYVWTHKGGSDGNRASGTIIKHGKYCDVAIGEFSDQCNEPTTGTRLNFKTNDGSAVKVFVFNGDDPHIENPEQRYDIRDYRFRYKIWKFFKELFPRFL